MNYSFGIVPSFRFTTFFFSEKGKVQQQVYVANDEVAATIAEITTAMINKRTINFITLFSGPAPLTTTRGICAWVKGWHIASAIPVVKIEGGTYYRTSEKKSEWVIVPLFIDRYIMVQHDGTGIKNKSEIEAWYNTIAEGAVRCHFYSKVSLKIKENVALSTALFPSITAIAEESFRCATEQIFSPLATLIPFEQHS